MKRFLPLSAAALVTGATVVAAQDDLAIMAMGAMCRPMTWASLKSFTAFSSIARR